MAVATSPQVNMIRVSQSRAVGRYLEQGITDEEQPGTKPIGGGADAQVVLQVRADEADVDAVDVIDNEHDDEQRQDMALDLRHGDGQQ